MEQFEGSVGGRCSLIEMLGISQVEQFERSVGGRCSLIEKLGT